MTLTQVRQPVQASPVSVPPRALPARWLVVGGFGLLLLAWLMANPLVAAPDEPVHYVRALGVGFGQWTGEQYVHPTDDMSQRDRLLAEYTRTFRIPARFALRGGHPNEPLGCVTWSTGSAACQRQPPTPAMLAPTIPLPGVWDRPITIRAPSAGGPQASYIGAYQPFLYLPLGLAARLGGSAEPGMRLARAADALLCLVLLAGAVRCPTTRGQLFGLLLAVTPTVLFLSSSVTTNSFEIVAGVSFLAAGLGLLSGRRNREVWIWLGVSAACLALAKATGPLWLAIDAAALVALAGVRQVWTLVRSQRRRALAIAAAAIAASAASIWWTAAYMGSPAGGLRAGRPFVRSAVEDLPHLVDGAIGLFGWYDTPLPHPLYLLGRVLLGGTLLLALLLGTWQERAVLIGAVAVAAAATVYVTAFIENPTGNVGQARHTMAVAVLVPLLSGHVIGRHRDRLRRLALPLFAAGVTGVAVLQFGAWYANAHRYAVGLGGSWAFLSAPQWTPPGGWWPWLLAAAAGAVALAGGALTGGRWRWGPVGRLLPAGWGGPAERPAADACPPSS